MTAAGTAAVTAAVPLVVRADRRAVFGGTAAACYRLGTGPDTGPDPDPAGVESPRRHAWH